MQLVHVEANILHPTAAFGQDGLQSIRIDAVWSTTGTKFRGLTQFRVLGREMLVLDPDLDNHILGYVRLRSAASDAGHLADALASPLLERDEAVDIISRYYDALNAVDRII